ncbi:TatD family hydrolase [Larkinella rosea]|uniref:TatD family deoxyribonuclease n=1 Tax=Larkinella rosea TaxID=2025312 RepID=A0A3P1C1M4_9BACT|nr:TatD family hydrolase [Larkinella rosea]RRB07148.1 TatD family deoxyribonuclease [Larkinella rosea]
MIDTHAHIYDLQFNDMEVMLKTAEEQGVTEIWMPNCAKETIDGMMALAEKYPDRCRPMMGLHPCYVCETVEDELATIEDWLNRYPFIAIGEIGLDFYWDLTHVGRQFEAFSTQLRWASERNLPISIHSRSAANGGRNAFSEAADLIEKLALPNLNGIFHCFVGTLDEARRAIELGFKLGIGGVSTFKNGGLDKVLPSVDLEHLVLETDAPYLAPVPYRGKRNEPAYLKLIAQRVADLKQLPLAVVDEQTTRNAQHLVIR